MAGGKVRISGVDYDITSGKTRIDGTVYNINGAKIKTGGTIHDIKFKRTYTISGRPNGYTQNGYYTVSNIANSYTNYNSDTYATLKVGGTGTSNFLYYSFNTSTIPSNAIIGDVTCIVRARSTYTSTIGTGNGSIALAVSNNPVTDVTYMQFDQEAHDYTLSYSNSTVSDANNLTLRIGAMTSIMTSAQHYVYVYGATLTITYTV